MIFQWVPNVAGEGAWIWGGAKYTHRFRADCPVTVYAFVRENSLEQKMLSPRIPTIYEVKAKLATTFMNKDTIIIWIFNIGCLCGEITDYLAFAG